jgi:hypothetical protein
MLLGVRWLIYFFEGTSRTRIPSLILTAILILMGFQLWVFGLVADLLDVNRRMLEDLQLGMRRSELGLKGPARSRFLTTGKAGRLTEPATRPGAPDAVVGAVAGGTAGPRARTGAGGSAPSGVDA